MLIVHETFNCKPGNASRLAKLFKEVMAENEEVTHIMTDVTGPFNKVIIVSQYENLSVFEKRYDRYMQNDEKTKLMKEKMKGYEELYFTGGREIYQTL